MTDPRYRFRQPKKTISLPLTNLAEAVVHEMACLDTSTGKIVPGKASTTLIALGYFLKEMTGDGTTEVPIDLFENIQLHYFDNDDAPNAVVAADRGSSCYIKDARTVSISSSGSTRSVAGIVLELDPVQGVGVLFGLPVKGATGATGTGVSQSVATRAALKAVAAADRADGDVVMVLTDGSLWRFVAASTLTTDEAEELAIEPTAGAGAWLRADKAFTLKLPIGFGTADAAPLLTVPAGFALRLTGMPFWEVTTGFTGGAASAIGLSASAIATTKGDLLGGAAGQVTAVLGTAGVKAGTIGPLIDTLAEIQAFFLKAADYLRFDRITSVYTAGAGFIHVPVSISIVA